MDFLWDKITEWLKEMLIGGIVSNLSGMFDATNQKVAEISGQVGLSPQAWNGSIFSMIQNLSETVIVPIAGAILAFVMTLELIQLITDKNNLNDMDTWIFFKWAFKSAAAVLIVTNTYFDYKEKYESRIADLSVEMEQLEDGLRTIDTQIEQHRALEQDAAQIKTDCALTGALIERLIDRIEVSHDKQITVRYRFQSEFETYAEVLEQCRNM